ncbi:PTS sugar transporter subunit IIC [Weissella uvarum]|nr:PTS sugar transporter subunit IIC [Weissella uvarum]
MRLQQVPLVRLVQSTLQKLFPFALFGSVIAAFRKTVLDDEGFINNVFNVPAWFPYYHAVNAYAQTLTQLTLGILAILSAYYMAMLTAKKPYHYEAGITAALAFIVLLNPHRNPRLALPSFSGMTPFGIHGLLLGLLFGYLIGWFWNWLAKRQKRHMHQEKVTSATSGVILVLGAAFLINVSLSVVAKQFNISTSSFSVSGLASQGSFLMTLLGSIGTSMLRWFGLTGFFDFDSSFTSGAANSNLMYALEHHSPWHVPYPFTEETLYDSFGIYAGVGGGLALIVALWLFTRDKRTLQISALASGPAFFGSSEALLIGLPVLLNPLYLIPFVLAPAVNVIIAAGLVALKVIPPAIYPVPIGTPGPLIGFIGSGGNIATFVFGFGLFVLDVLIYMPFVKLDNKMKATRTSES